MTTHQPSHTPPQREALREQFLKLGPCNGPYERSHSCSSAHCDHCGLCDISEDVLHLLDQVVQAEIAGVFDRIFEMSPTKNFEHWKPQDALAFYERLKAYETELLVRRGGQV